MFANPDEAPHLNRATFDALLDRIDHAPILALIESWMSARLLTISSPEDLWQETLTFAWRDREKFDWRGLRSFRSWLLTIARNRIHDLSDYDGAAKRGSGNGACSVSALRKSQYGSSGWHPADSCTPSRPIHARELARCIRAALRELPDDDSELLRLRLLEELPMVEVAKRLGVARTTANTRFYRASRSYRRALERHIRSSGLGR